MTPQEFQKRLTEREKPGNALPDVTMHAMCGGKIRHGASREVFEVRNDPTMVIKHVHVPFIGPNLLEFFVWKAVTDSKWRAVFGECLAISESGRYLMMERLDDIEAGDYSKTPNVPFWMSDVKPDNFGRTRAGLIKLRDYAMAKLDGVLGGADGHRTGWQTQADMRRGRRAD